jgi:LmbE family N-acetylglucosaminyl deacetylase
VTAAAPDAGRPAYSGRGSILVVMAHPDDPDFFCGGSVARWAAQGREIVYCLLTRGDKGADEPGVDPQALSETREAEQRAAASVLGVKQVLFLDHRDGELVADYELKRDVVRVIRQTHPDVLVTSDPSTFYASFINHADHRVAGEVALDAVWPGTRSALYYPELYQDEGLEPHKVHEVYIAGSLRPDVTIDITEYFDTKIRALAEHKTQIDDPDALAERLRGRMLDSSSPPEAPRYVERFKYIKLR